MPQHNNLPHLKSDDLFKIQSRMDDLEKTRLTAIERQVTELRHKWVEPIVARVDAIELYINGSLMPKLNHFVDQADFDDVHSRFIRLEGDTLPHMVNNITDMQRHMVIIHRAVDLLKGLQNASDDEIARALKEVTSFNPTSPPSETMSNIDLNATSESSEEDQKESSGGNNYAVPELDVTTTLGTRTITEDSVTESTALANTTMPNGTRRCYICGDKTKNESCTRKTNDDEGFCPRGQNYCMTDVFEDGRVRQIYKRCATKVDCKEMRNSSEKCNDATFLTLTPMICHFCCISDLCNNSIRPTKDLYRM